MHGMMFKPWKIKAISEDPDREWLTRRTGGLEIINQEPDIWVYRTIKDGYFIFEALGLGLWAKVKSDYKVDEIVYEKEAWEIEQIEFPMAEISYVADVYGYHDHDVYIGDKKLPTNIGRVQSSFYMPAWAARYFLKILGVRVERLQEITEEDAIKEGCQLIARTIQPFELKPYPHFTAPERPFTYKDNFIGIWDSTNKDYPYKKNPWVFVYTLKPVEKPDEND